MEETPFSVRLELEIHRLLKTNASLESIHHLLVNNYSKELLPIEDLTTFSIFFINTGQYATLTDFLTRCLERGLQIPWAHFCETLFLSTLAIPESIKSAIIRGAEMQGQLEELTRSKMLDHFDERLFELRQTRKEKRFKHYQLKKEEMLATAKTLQTQGILNEEEKLLNEMIKIFPGDKDVLLLIEKRKQKENLGLLQKKNDFQHQTWLPLEVHLEKDEATLKSLHVIEHSMHEFLGENNLQDSELSQDFSIAHLMWENYEASLSFINPSTKNKSTKWLQLELLLSSRKFIELLDEITLIEKQWSQEPDSVFALLYLKAQAYWELNKKNSAIEILESLSANKPDYRNSRILLSIWKGEKS